MNKSIDELIPDFERVMGQSFKNLSVFAKNELVGVWALQGDWERVRAAMDIIDPFMKIGALNGLTWHAWLLTRQSDEAFGIWEEIRGSKEVDSMQWNDAAAYLAYANQPQYLTKLRLSDWNFPIHAELLKKVNELYFAPSGAVEVTGAKSFEKQMDSVVFNSILPPPMSAWQFACYHGSHTSISLALKTYKKWEEQNAMAALRRGHLHDNTIAPSWSSTCFAHGHAIFMRRANAESIVSFLGNIKNNSDGLLFNFYQDSYDLESSDDSGKSNGWNKLCWPKLQKRENVLIQSARILNAKESAILIGSLSEMDMDNVKKSFEENRLDWDFFIKNMNLHGYEDRATVWHDFLKNNCSGVAQQYYMSDLFTAIKKDNMDGVKFLLKYDPDFLERKTWTYEDDAPKSVSRGKKMGTALVRAVMLRKEDIANFLISLGASVKPLKEMLEYKPFRANAYYASCVPFAENLILKESVNKKFKKSINVVEESKQKAL